MSIGKLLEKSIRSRIFLLKYSRYRTAADPGKAPSKTASP
jgi:hypothetical protein